MNMLTLSESLGKMYFTTGNVLGKNTKLSDTRGIHNVKTLLYPLRPDSGVHLSTKQPNIWGVRGKYERPIVHCKIDGC